MNKQFVSILVASFALLAVLVPPARADLVGTQVYGTLAFGTYYSINRFDPSYGGYAGSLNTVSDPVTISPTATEFGYGPGGNIDTADFTGSQLIVGDNVLETGTNSGSPNWTMTFTSTAFGSLSLSKVSDNFLNGGVTGVLNGDVITLTWAGEQFSVVNQEAIFNLTPVPEPTTMALACLGGLASLVAFRRRQ